MSPPKIMANTNTTTPIIENNAITKRVIMIPNKIEIPGWNLILKPPILS